LRTGHADQDEEHGRQPRAPFDDRRATDLSGASVDATDAAPTEGQNQVFDLLSKRLQEQLREWITFLSKDVGALNKLIDQGKLTVLDSQQAK